MLSNVELFVGDPINEFTLPFDYIVYNNITKVVQILGKYKDSYNVAITETKNLHEEKLKKVKRVQLLIEELKLQKEIIENGQNKNNNNGQIQIIILKTI